MLEVPPGDLPAVVTALEDLGTVLSFDQLAEDVTDQLADLDTRIANMRASVERVRALYAEAVDIDSVVRLEAELTRRETDLEVLLATQSTLEDRVTMSTLTLDITSTATATTPVEDDDPGIVDAAAAGWGAFVGGLFAIVLVLAAIAPFVLAALVLALIALAVLRRIGRNRPTITASEDVSAPEQERPRRTRPPAVRGDAPSRRRSRRGRRTAPAPTRGRTPPAAPARRAPSPTGASAGPAPR